MRFSIAFLLALALATGLVLHGQGEKKPLSPASVKLAEQLRDERDQINVENQKLQAHLAAFNVKVAEALIGFRKELGAKSTDQFDFDELTFKPAQSQPVTGRGR